MAARYGYTMGRREMRRNRRASRPHLRVEIGGAEFDVLNWSLGGLLVAAGAAAGMFTEGSVVPGAVKRPTGADRVVFSAVVVRGDGATGELAVMFETLDESLFAFFERCMAAALKH